VWSSQKKDIVHLPCTLSVLKHLRSVCLSSSEIFPGFRIPCDDGSLMLDGVVVCVDVIMPFPA
jgi:hypothetical protein